MGELTQRVTRQLQAGGEEARAALLDASELLRKAWNSGFRPAFDYLEAEDVTPDEANELRHALQQYCERETSAPHRRMGLSALAKQGEQYVVDDLARELHILLEAQTGLNRDLYQLLLALENVGEQVYPEGERGSSVTEVQRNTDAARAYLARRGTMVPY